MPLKLRSISTTQESEVREVDRESTMKLKDSTKGTMNELRAINEFLKKGCVGCKNVEAQAGIALNPPGIQQDPRGDTEPGVYLRTEEFLLRCVRNPRKRALEAGAVPVVPAIGSVPAVGFVIHDFFCTQKINRFHQR